MRRIDHFTVNITNTGTTSSGQELTGGRYGYVAAASTWGGGSSVGITLPAATTASTTVQVSVLTNNITANAFGIIEVPPGPITITTIGTVVAGVLTVNRIPSE